MSPLVPVAFIKSLFHNFPWFSYFTDSVVFSAFLSRKPLFFFGSLPRTFPPHYDAGLEGRGGNNTSGRSHTCKRDRIQAERGVLLAPFLKPFLIAFLVPLLGTVPRTVP